MCAGFSMLLVASSTLPLKHTEPFVLQLYIWAMQSGKAECLEGLPAVWTSSLSALYSPETLWP